MWVDKSILERLSRVQFFYMDKATTALYNKYRGDKPRAFSGWCWHHGAEEGGPFKTVSAARVHAYYTLVLREKPPSYLPSFNRSNVTYLPKMRRTG